MSREPEHDENDEILDAILRAPGDPIPSNETSAVVIPFPTRDEIIRRRMRQKRPWAD